MCVTSCVLCGVLWSPGGQQVCVYEHGDGGMFCRAVGTRVQGSPQHPLPCSPRSFQRQNQVSGSPHSVSTLWDGPVGQYKVLSICLAVPVPDTLPPPSPQGPRGCSGYQVAAYSLGHWQGTLAPRCVTCRGPVWTGYLCRVIPALLAASSGTRRRAVRD